MDLEDDDDLFIQHTKLERLQFDGSHKTKKLLGSSIKETPAADGKRSMKLPKLDVPTFDGDLLNWSQFWEQFSVSVHECKNLSDTEKLVYLQQAVKKGSAKNAIEGLTRTADSYAEAISYLKARYDRPRLIYRTHVQKIMNAPSLREGRGMELRRLYDTILQHIRALKTMDGDLTSAFLTSIIELKLDPDTMFEWQKHSQEQKTTPQYEDILGFIDLRAQASETAALGKKQVKVNQTGGGKPHHSGRNVTSFATHADSKHHCVLCESERHPLYACPKFKGMVLVEKLSTIQYRHLCKNCLGRGHFLRQCRSLHKCKKCQRPHHTLLHDDQEDQAGPCTHVASNAAVKLRSSSLLMSLHPMALQWKPGLSSITPPLRHLSLNISLRV